METVENAIENATLRNTLEYAEARALLMERDRLRAEIALIDIQIGNIRNSAPLAFQLAKADMQLATESMLCAGSQEYDSAIRGQNIQPDFHSRNLHNILALGRHAVQATDMDAERINIRLQRFLSGIDQAVPWSEIEALITPVYERWSLSTPRVCLLSMIRLYFLHQWCSLSDEEIIDKIYNCPVIRGFIGIHPRYTVLPDQAALIQFRGLLEHTGLGQKLSMLIVDAVAPRNQDRCDVT